MQVQVVQVQFVYLAHELNVVAFDVLDDHDFHFGEKVKRQLVDGVAQNALLDEKHVAVDGLDFLHNVQNVLALLLEYTIHLRVVVDDDVVFHLNKYFSCNITNYDRYINDFR